MKKKYDGEQIYCAGCGHKWVLICDKEITETIHKLWLIRVYWQHINIIEEGGVK